jgi:ribonuclease P protein component
MSETPTNPAPVAAEAAPEDAADLHFRARHRLSHALEFQAVFGAQVKRYRGPIALFTLPNGKPNSRLGLSISGRVGSSVVRNHLKRLIREAFRLEQHNLARSADGTGYDIVVTARPHQHLPLAAYRLLLRELVADAHKVWERRAKSAPTAARNPTPEGTA